MDSQINVTHVLSNTLQENVLNATQVKANTNDLSHAVQQFEAYFIQSMLRSMRSASLSSGLLESDKTNFFRDWHDQQLANDLASKETFAVAKLLRNQFDDAPRQSPQVASLAPTAIFRSSPYNQTDSVVIPKNTTLKQTVTKEIKEYLTPENKRTLFTPEKFVQQVYPYAEQAASKLQVSADVLIAIAALETGWGVHTPKSSSSQDSFNYFGIKANNWNGAKVTSTTNEFNGEYMIEVTDSFRAYASPEESFNDFASFLLESPRYKDALKFSHNANKFVHALQKAGYATDPNYAKKVISILNGTILKSAISSIDTSEVTANLDKVSKH